jgi:hypothetical protein
MEYIWIIGLHGMQAFLDVPLNLSHSTRRHSVLPRTKAWPLRNLKTPRGGWFNPAQIHDSIKPGLTVTTIPMSRYMHGKGNSETNDKKGGPYHPKRAEVEPDNTRLKTVRYERSLGPTFAP